MQVLLLLAVARTMRVRTNESAEKFATCGPPCPGMDENNTNTWHWRKLQTCGKRPGQHWKKRSMPRPSCERQRLDGKALPLLKVPIVAPPAFGVATSNAPAKEATGNLASSGTCRMPRSNRPRESHPLSTIGPWKALPMPPPSWRRREARFAARLWSAR